MNVECEVIDQREIQRLGGKAVKFPSSVLIKQLLDETGIDYSFIFDCTYGEGRFYGYFRDKIDLLVGADVEIWSWVVEPDLFVKKPVWSSYKVLKKLGLKPSLLIVDPPFSKWYRYEKRQLYHYVWAGAWTIVEYAVKAAEALHVKHVLVHWDRVETFNKRLLSVKAFKPFTRYLNERYEPTYFYILEV